MLLNVRTYPIMAPTIAGTSQPSPTEYNGNNENKSLIAWIPNPAAFNPSNRLTINVKDKLKMYTKGWPLKNRCKKVRNIKQIANG